MSNQNTTQRSWYLIYTKPKQEKLAQENLGRQGFETYYPLFCTTVRRRGRYQSVIEPMFPRYIFIHLDTINDNWAPIRSTLGVANLVRFGDAPAQIPDVLVEILQSQDDEEGLHNIKNNEFKIGDCVRILDGVMAGYEGILESKKGNERVMVMLDIAGKHTRVSISKHNLLIA